MRVSAGTDGKGPAGIRRSDGGWSVGGSGLGIFVLSSGSCRDLIGGFQLFLHGNCAVVADAVYQGHLSDAEYIIHNYESGMRYHVSDPISSGRASICGTDIPADTGCQSVSECNDRESKPVGESASDLADSIAVRGVSADRYGLV